MGGGYVIRQCVDTGLPDELIIHLVPIVLGSGTPLLVDCHRRQLVQRDVRVSPTATPSDLRTAHLTAHTALSQASRASSTTRTTGTSRLSRV
jgi:dihydrofolate reductase